MSLYSSSWTTTHRTPCVFVCFWMWWSFWWWDRVGLGWGGDNTKRVSCHATWSSLALDATLDDLICIRCYAIWLSLVLEATLRDLHLYLMLCYMIFICIRCYATWSSLAFSQMRMGMGLGWGGVGRILHVSLATLHDLHLHLMLR